MQEAGTAMNMTADSLVCSACGRKLDAMGSPTVSCACGYVAVVGGEERSFPLAQALRECLPEEAIRMIVRDGDDPLYVRAVVGRGLEYCLKRVRTLVDSEPDVAAASVWPCLLEFESVSRDYRRGERSLGVRMVHVDRATQILLACLYQLGAPHLVPTQAKPDDVRRFVWKFSGIAMTAAGLGNILADLEWGLVEGDIRDGILFVRQTPVNNRLVEWQLNRDALWTRTKGRPHGDDVFSDASARAQEIFLGCSPAQGRSLFANGHEALRTLAVRQEGTLYEIPRAACAEPLRCLFDHLALTPERVARFAVPFYWDLGEIEEKPGGGEHDVRKVAVRSWFNYYPLVPVQLKTGEPGFLVSAESLTYALGNLESYKGRLLQRIHDCLKQAGPAEQAKRDAVGRLRKEANTRFETIAAEQARELGFEAANGIYLLDGVALPGGEIDLLMAATQDSDVLLVLAEIKDFDMTLHRMHGEETLRGKIRDAESQLARKAEDVRTMWRRLVEVISEGRLTSPAGRVILVKVLITSDYLPPFLSSNYPAIPLEGMAEFVEMLRQGAYAFPPRFAETARELLA